MKLQNNLIFLALGMAPLSLMGQVQTDSVTYELGEVVVRADPRVTSLKGDALLTRVSGTPLQHAGTANDVLTQVPMVLGSDGDFEVFGKGSPAIYVNGQQLQDVSELSQVSSANIKSVEVLTNPGAKYDASVRAVINITLKAPQGDGLSGLVRAQASFQKYWRTMDQVNLKYRTGGLEVFSNFGYMGGKHEYASTIDMLTRSSVLWNQRMEQSGYGKVHDFYGKVGFSYMIGTSHSLGAYYTNGFHKTDARYRGFSTVMTDGKPYDELSVLVNEKTGTVPKHHANLYYSGAVGELGVDFNMDLMWQKKNADLFNDETSGNFNDAQVASSTTNRSRLFAERLVFSYPVWRGGVEIGEECTLSRFATGYLTDASMLTSADSRVDESNVAGFVQLAQRFGTWNIGAGLRYEHVAFRYMENGLRRDDMDRTYDNLFPSVSVSAMIRNVQMSVSYTHKTRRPSYSDLDGTVDYINRFTFESGNPYLKPEKIHNVQLSGAWRHFFGQVSWSFKKAPVLTTTVACGEDGERKLITKDNFPKMQQLEAFVGGQFRLGLWQPKVNAGIIKQWLTVDYGGGRKRLDNPIGLVQFQNAIHLPFDIWLNVDMQWMSAGNGENGKISSTSCLDAKLYKAFVDNSLSITAEVNDILGRNVRNITAYDKDVTIIKSMHVTGSAIRLTVQYTFNDTRDRYKGRGAGADEIDRF